MAIRLAPRILAVFMLLTAFAAPAFAQEEESCPHLPALLSAAGRLLAEPAERPAFWRDLHGDDAAYLTIRRGGLDDAKARDLISRLAARSHPPQRIRELALAYAAPAERMAMIAELASGAGRGSVLPELGRSALRALVAEGQAKWLVEEMARWKRDDPEGFGRAPLSHDIAYAVADLDDAAKAELAASADEAGLWLLAVSVASMRDDLSGVLELVDRMPPEAQASWLDAAGNRRRWIATSLGQAEMRPEFNLAAQPAEIREVDAGRPAGPAFRAIQRLVARYPDAILLGVSLNQTGELALGTVVAATVTGMIERGEVDPQADPDAVMAAILTGLDHVLGREKRELLLASFHMASGTGAQGDPATDHVDRVLARAALAPFLRGETRAPPERPPVLTAGFGWEHAVALAEALAGGAAVAEEDRLAAADLLAAAGRFDEALSMLASAADWRPALARTHELMLALDRRCGAVLEPLLPMMPPVYRFAPR